MTGIYELELENGIPVLRLENAVETRVVRVANDCAKIAEETFRLAKKAEEHVILIGMDVKLNTIGVFELSKGSVDASFAGTREAFIRLLMIGASSFVMVHNHPSGDVTPSAADIKTSEIMEKAGEIMGIKFVDSIIVAEGVYASYKDGWNKCNIIN